MMTLAVFLFATSIVRANDDAKPVSPEPVPLNDQSRGAKAALKKMAANLAHVHPAKMRDLRSLETKEGIYVLYGDLFRTGHIFALTALSGGKPDAETDTEQADNAAGNDISPIGLGFAEWTGTAWEARGLWRIEPIWRPKGWESSENDSLATTPATKPFWMKLLGGDGRPKVIVAGPVDRYFQEHYVFHFAPKTHALVFVALAMAEPELIDGWVRLYDKSPRRAIWEEWTYLRWEGEKLAPKAAWHDEAAYDSSDKSFVKATRFDSKGGKQEFMFETGEAGGYSITRDGHPFAQVKFQLYREPSTQAEIATASGAPHAFLFEKLTGVPRKLYIVPPGWSASVRLEKLGTIRVTGSKEAVRMLSSGW